MSGLPCEINARAQCHAAALRSLSKTSAQLLPWLTITGSYAHSRQLRKSEGQHHAAFRGHMDACEVLLEHGTEVNVRDDEDQTALNVAIFFDYTPLIQLLRDRGGVK